MLKVAIQGIAGAYHDIAARHYFKQPIELVECVTFDDIFKAMQTDHQVRGILAIENTIAGSLLQNYELQLRYGFPVTGEYKLRISHCLCALPGQTLDQISEVWSHPIALMQCSRFLETMPGIRVLEHIDTALAARDIAQQQRSATAAICSELAAKNCNLQILERGIETNKHNFTRFLVVSHPDVIENQQSVDSINKASLVFTLPHTEGSLSRVLSVFSFYGINLTKIQSLPIIGREWEYRFYIDLSFGDYVRYRQSVDAITPLISELISLGEYPEGEQSML